MLVYNFSPPPHRFYNYLQSHNTNESSSNTRTERLHNRARRSTCALRPCSSTCCATSSAGTGSRGIRTVDSLVDQALYTRIVRIIVRLEVAGQRTVPRRDRSEGLESTDLGHIIGDVVRGSGDEGGERGFGTGGLGDGRGAEGGGKFADLGGDEVLEGVDIGAELEWWLVCCCCSSSLLEDWVDEAIRWW